MREERERGKCGGITTEKPQKKTLKTRSCRRVDVHISGFGDCRLHSLHANPVMVIAPVLFPGLLLRQQQSQRCIELSAKAQLRHNQ